MTLLLTTDTIGGTWTHTLCLAEALEVPCVIATLGPAARADQLAAARRIPGCTLIDTGLPLDWCSPDAGTLDHTAARLAELASRHDATAAHLHAPCLATPVWRLPVVVTAHSCIATWWAALRTGPLPPHLAWHPAATQAGLELAARVIAPSHAFADALRHSYGLTRGIDVIHNGLKPYAMQSVRRLPIVLAAGRLWDEAKNIAMLNEAAAQTATPIHVAGPTISPDNVAAAIDNLTKLGTLAAPALRAGMAQAAIFAAPSRYEPFGLAVLEAAQSATPLVLGDIPTFRELWSGAAIFVSPTDARAWAAALETLMADPAARAALGEAAQARASTYTQHAMVAATARLHAGLPKTLRAA